MLRELDVHCGSPFFNSSTVWYTENPDFPECFQRTVLVWIPCGLFWLYLPFEIYSLKKRRRPQIPWTFLNGTKTFLGVCLMVLSVIELFHWVVLYWNYSLNVASVYFYSNFIKVSTFLAVTVLIAFHRKYGRRSSGFLFTFWIMFTSTTVISFRTCLLSKLNEESSSDILLYTTCVLSLPVVIAQLILSSTRDSLPFGYARAKNSCPINDSSLFSRILFSWFDKMVILGHRSSLKRDDMWLLNNEYRADRVFPQFEKNLQKHPRSTTEKPPSIFFPVLKTFWVPIVQTGLLEIFACMADFATPIMLKYLIDFVSSDEPTWRGYFYCSVLFIFAFANACIENHQNWISFCTGIKLKASVVSLIYRKAIRMSGNVKRTSSTGEIVNLMSIDAGRVHIIYFDVHECWVGIIQVAIALYMLWAELGISILAGLVALVVTLPINSVVVSKYHKTYVEMMKFVDKRIKLMNEILAGIKVLKLYAWEKPFFAQLSKLRNSQLKKLKKILFLGSFVGFLYHNVPLIMTLTTFITYVLIDENNILDAKKIFVSISLFDILNEQLLMIPIVTISVTRAVVSLKRLDKFFNEQELDPNAVSHDISAEHAITIENGTFSWDSDTDPVLKNVNVDCPHEHLVAVLGSVGSGKSSLISAVLGEMEKRNGRVNVKGSVALVAQQAWIQNATLRDNIIFGSPFDQNKYDNVLEACALKPDLDLLPAGDQTEIGERGINLSGGQKQRVSLARAVYSDADVYLLDDPLSAVDAHVGKHIFDNVIGPNGSLKNKTRLFVTNGISYLNQTDSIVVLDKGSVSEVGTFDQLVSKKGAFAEFLQNYLNEHQVAEASNEQLINSKRTARTNSTQSESERSPKIYLERKDDAVSTVFRRISRSLSNESDASIRLLSTERLNRSTSVNEQQKSSKLIEEEEAATGKVKWSVYLTYFRALGLWCLVALALCQIFSTALNVYSRVWLSDWSQDPPTQDDRLRNHRLGVYAGLGFGQMVLLLTASLVLAIGSVRASMKLHNSLLANVLRLPISFFDVTPLGRILNRFSKDMDLVDSGIAHNVYYMISMLVQSLSVVLTVCWVTPLILIIVVPSAIIYYLIQKFYISTSRQLKRLESIAHSPVFNQFSETLFGTVTIRAFQRSSEFILKFEGMVDEYHTCAYPNLAANRWLGIRLSLIGNLLCFFAALFAVNARRTIDPGIMGLTVSYASTIVFLLEFLVETACSLEANIVAVERIDEYATATTEAPDEIESTKPAEGWPHKGEIQFKNYSTRYREGLDLVLNQLRCDIQREEKIGIVGRTGAGKSSMALALFRIVEPTDGEIIVDGIDISKLGLGDLRSRFTIIPQDPVLFSGSLRMNLDPFDKHSDDQVWQALEHSHLTSFVESLPLGLQHVVSEGGDNLSVGQRQLICLARALLRKSKVLVLDEATAAVDLETDEIIQGTIRKEFADCTILTIAHRLNTIMDSTRIMVLDAGRIKEFDTPNHLLANSNTLFYTLAKDAGIVK